MYILKSHSDYKSRNHNYNMQICSRIWIIMCENNINDTKTKNDILK